MAQKKKSQPKAKKAKMKVPRKSRALAFKNANQAVLFRRKTDLPWGNLLRIEAEKAESEKEESGYFRRKADLERVNGLSDSELINVIHNQNREAYKELFQRYQRKLFVYILHLVGNREETEDILQNVFTKTYKSIDHFDKDRKFSSWIYRIAHNEAVNYLKRKNKKHFVSWEDVSSSKDKLDMSDNEMPIEEKWMHAEITKEIHEAMEKLPKRYKEILVFRYFSEYSYETIGKMLNKPVNTVGTLINRAKKKLFEMVKEDGLKNEV